MPHEPVPARLVAEAGALLDVRVPCREHLMFDERDLVRLEQFIASHDRSITLREFSDGDRDPAAVCVRHDVDDDVEKSLRFAQWEAERGIVSSYYLLPTEPYWPAAARECGLKIEALGHEVGVHHDAYRVVGGDPEKALALLADQAETMRSWGLTVYGCADHGGGPPANVELWREHGRRPEEAGLMYEAYLLHQLGTNYISDNHGWWRAPLVRTDRPTHMLIHPQHWTI